MKKILKQFSLFEIFLTIVILTIHIYAATADAYTFPNVWFKRDDAYYYFKVAQNISEGLGSSFDKINLTNGYHPLWMLICIPIFALARFDVILPLRVLLIVIAFIQIATSILMYRLIKKYLSETVAILAASFWSFNFYIQSSVYQWGLETPIAAFFVICLLYKLSEFEESWRKQTISWQQISWLGFLSALVMFSRLDLIFLAFIVGIWILFRGHAIRYLMPFDIFIIFASMTSAVILRTDFESYNIFYVSSTIQATVLALVVKISALYFLGGYQHPRTKSFLKNILQIFYASAISSVVIAGIYFLFIRLTGGQYFPRSALALDFGISLILFSALRLTAYLFSQPNQSTPQNPFAELKSNWKTWFHDGIAFYGVLAGLLIIYMLFNHFTFGTSSPVSGQIKRWWGGMESSAYEAPASSWSAYFGLDSKHAFKAWQPFTKVFSKPANWLYFVNPRGDANLGNFYLAIAIFCVLIFVLLLLNKKRNLSLLSKLGFIPLISGSGVHLLSYTATGYGGAKEWYWISQMILLTFTFSLVIEILIKPLFQKLVIRRAFEIASLIISINLAYQFGFYVKNTMVHDVFPADKPYMDVVKFLEENTSPNEVIGMTGGGNVGYFIKDRTIVNMDGLINSYQYYQALKAGEAPIYLHEHEMTVVFANPQLLNIPPYFGQFAPYLRKYNSYGGKALMYLLKEPKY